MLVQLFVTVCIAVVVIACLVYDILILDDLRLWIKGFEPLPIQFYLLAVCAVFVQCYGWYVLCAAWPF